LFASAVSGLAQKQDDAYQSHTGLGYIPFNQSRLPPTQLTPISTPNSKLVFLLFFIYLKEINIILQMQFVNITNKAKDPR
jgi:hypothetical protein